MMFKSIIIVNDSLRFSRAVYWMLLTDWINGADVPD